MFFILSKTIKFFTMPIVLIVIFLILSGTLKNKVWRKRFFWLGLGMLLFFSNAFISNEVMRAWEVDPVPLSSINKTYEVGIVLGGVIQGDTKITDRAFFSKGADRIYHAVMLYKRGIIKRIFVSGGTSRIIDILHCLVVHPCWNLQPHKKQKRWQG